MGRKVTTISIDEDILRLAKKEIPNISIFVEDCFKAYFGINNPNIRSIDDNMQLIKNCLLEIHYASIKGEVKSAEKEYSDKEIQSAWLKVYGNFRNNHSIVSKDLNHLSEVAGVTSFDLRNLLSTLDLELNKNELVKASEWEFAKQYLKK